MMIRDYKCVVSIWYSSKDSIQRRIDKNVRRKFQHNISSDITSTCAYTSNPPSFSADAHAYSLDLFTTSLSSNSALILFQETV